jgi:hypothetical protein
VASEALARRRDYKALAAVIKRVGRDGDLIRKRFRNKPQAREGARELKGTAPTKKARRRHLYEDLGLSMSESDRERAERAAERAEREAAVRDRAK